MECNHEKTTIRHRNRKVGLIGHQCDKCLCSVGAWVKHSEINLDDVTEDWLVGPVDDLFAIDKAAEKAAFDAQYSEYLKSPEWGHRRYKILQRSMGICEGCLSRKSEEVHHKTYAHVFNEFAFELVALCSKCHDRIHQGKKL